MQQKDLDTEKKILLAARKVFAEFGFGAARIDEIAKIAKVNKAMIYYHFKNKEDLYLAVIHSFFDFDFLSNEELNHVEGKSCWEILLKTIHSFEKNIQKDNIEKSMLICREMVSRGQIFQIMREKYWIPFFERIQNLIQKGISTGEFSTSENPYFLTFSIVAHVVFYYISGVTYKDSSLYPKLFPENYSEKMEKYIISFLKKQLNIES